MQEEGITLKERLQDLALKFSYGRFDQCKIGHLLIRAWQSQHPGVKPVRVRQEEDGEEFLVYSYPLAFIPVMDKIIRQYFADKWEWIQRGRQAAMKAKQAQEEFVEEAGLPETEKLPVNKLPEEVNEAATLEAAPELTKQETPVDQTTSVQAEPGTQTPPAPGKRPRIKKALYSSGQD